MTKKNSKKKGGGKKVSFGEKSTFLGLKPNTWILFLLALALGGVLGDRVAREVTRDIPEVTDGKLQGTDKIVSRVFSSNGEVIYLFAEEKRFYVTKEDISPHFFNALVAMEDKRFYSHPGVDMKALAAVARDSYKAGELTRGASTLTQQLAKLHFLSPERKFKRKFKEAILALNIEKHFTKEQILEKYANKVFLGHGRYGVESASRYYFGKPAKELEPHEGALLVGMLKAPEGYSPIRHPEKALFRRNLALRLMVAQGYLTADQGERFQAIPLVDMLTRPEQRVTRQKAPYLVEEVRKWAEKEFSPEQLYTRGLDIYTTIDVDLQERANLVVRDGIRSYDRRHGYRGPLSNLLEDEVAIEAFLPQAWIGPFSVGQALPCVVLKADKSSLKIQGPLGAIELEKDSWRWTRKNPGQILSRGDEILLEIIEVNDEGKPTGFVLDQIPAANGALLAMDPFSGQVKAMVGGFDIYASYFNRAVQARRQTGSAIKPLLWASAVERGMRPTDIIRDEPTLFLDPRNKYKNFCTEGYGPKNYDHKYKGSISLATALAHSRNIPAVKLLNQMGYGPTIRILEKFGIGEGMKPYPSLALGVFEVPLLQMVSAYSVFPNNGVKVDPHFVTRVTDRGGKELFRARPKAVEVIRPTTAYLTTRMMEGVIHHGTGAAARRLGGHLGGKTGTTDDYSDAWFLGFSPDLAVGTWVGFNEMKSLGRGETGARAALPIWKGFMSYYLEREGKKDLDYTAPPGIISRLIDPHTGLLASLESGCQDVVKAQFAKGQEPLVFCSPREHWRQSLPPILQGFDLTYEGRLRMSGETLLSLIESPGHQFSFDPFSATLSFVQGQGKRNIAVELTSGLPLETSGDFIPVFNQPLPQNGSFRCGARVEYISSE